MPSPSLAVVVIEDNHHKMLIYRYLRRRGLSEHQITLKLSPSGKGSAEQWIRRVFPYEVKAHRVRQAKAASALIIMVDADNHTVQGRLNQLRDALHQFGVADVGDAEPIAQLIPRRNVETWVLCLAGHKADEETDYSRTSYDWPQLIPQAAERLFQWRGANPAVPNDTVDSLRRGLRELSKLAL